MMSQIILPVVLTGLLMVASIFFISTATFRHGGDVGRWAGISTIWLLLPVMLAGVIFLVVLIGLIYLTARALQILPAYTGRVQEYVNKAHNFILRGANMAVKPIFLLGGWIAKTRAFFGKAGQA